MLNNKHKMIQNQEGYYNNNNNSNNIPHSILNYYL